MADIIDKPFILFAGPTFYAYPGWMGYDGEFASLEAACLAGELAISNGWDWWQVVDLRSKHIVAGKGKSHTGLRGFTAAWPAGEKEQK